MLIETSHPIIIFCTIFLPIFFFEISSATDTITWIHSLKDGPNSTTLVSSGQTFELGFFSPRNSKNRYIGIWYKISPAVIVWVANRNNPLSDSYGELAISEKESKLVLLNQFNSIIWSTSSSQRGVENLVARLLDTGNLVLGTNESMSSGSYLWQSFDFPTDTLLAGMKLGRDWRTGLDRYLTSWKSADDPSNGNFTCRMNFKGLPQSICAAGSVTKIRAGTWNGVQFHGLTVVTNTVFKPIYVFNENESYLMFETDASIGVTRIIIDHAGQPQRHILPSGSNEWSVMYSLPYDPCDNYGSCGANGVCRVTGDPICQCLEGFTPSSREEWEVLNWSKGCVRKTPLDCQKGEGFVKLTGIKLPDLLEFWLNKSMSLEECKETCLQNCSCVAYANSDASRGGSGCLIWLSDLIDIRELRVKDNDFNVFLRMSASDMKLIYYKDKRNRLKTVLAASISSGICILFALFYGFISWKFRQRVKGKSMDEDIELPLFNLATVKSATKNFLPENMIGKGGFGPVYKGNLSTGQEIAVKRLAKDSGQGPKEFKNEVELIAKLQHKNLVALLGCCIQGDERILIYEYMPHKSLDSFIFENTRSNILTWPERFDIVMGIAKGLLYLHHDSKIQIIHRDLKASNILLDRNMNPKISDFGLARICGGDEKENRTRTVVGTYGYMSPEYAVDGKFSVKSDVFSFGVLLLEIVSGKRNRKFIHPDHHHNLLGHAWLLWSKGEAIELMDVGLKNSRVESQVLRCIHVGLLCVQKYSEDRPTMSSVLLMLANEGAKLPNPKEPGFFMERSSDNGSVRSSSRDNAYPSQNKVTITFDAR